MCGIAGYIGKKSIKPNQIGRTLELMKNRGPDYQSWSSFNHADTNIYLLHSRLSIIDLDERSNQPFKFDDFTIVFNGEIYNYIEIRDDLIKKGYRFKTDSDTEVLLKAYAEYGKDCVQHFNGMWAFAIWDHKKKQLFLSRDRFGEKPLYYFQDTDGFFFASEIKGIQALLDKKLSINYDHLKRYMIYGYKFLYKTEKTYFHGIRQIEYGSNVFLNTDLNFNQYKYWIPECNMVDMSIDEAIEGTRNHLLESMRLRLRADVPLAFCLSGGVDSASLVSIAKKEFQYDVATFSIIDNDERYNETSHINATINDLNCEHFLIELNYKNMIDRLEGLINYHDSPISTISYLIHSMLSEQINKHGYKISVSGTSADELFTGYYDHFNLHLYEMRDHPNFNDFLSDWEKYTGKFVRNPYLKDPKLYFKDKFIRKHNHLNSDIFASFFHDDYSINVNETDYSDSLLRNRMLNELFHEATPVILHEDDLNSMMFSIENRSPYLDINLFNFAYSIPNKHLINNGYAKYILRKSMEGILNDEVRLERRKKGFNASINSLINFKDRKTIDYLLSDSPIFDLIKKNKIETILKENFYQNSQKKFIFNFVNSKIFLENFS